MRRASVVFALLIVAALVWCYLPPAGQTVKLPSLEPLLEPSVGYEAASFIDTGEHVYYRVRLTQLVPWNFSRHHLQTLRERGVQFRAVVHRPFGPGPTVEGWEAALAWEESLAPYEIGYRKSSDRTTPSFPVKLRWPWLYVRFGRDILDPLTSRIWPDSDTTRLSPMVPRYPGSVLAEAVVHDRFLQLVFFAAASESEVLSYYTTLLEASAEADPVVGDHYVAATPQSGRLWAALGRPERIEAQVDAMIYTDRPLVVFSREAAARISEGSDPRQPAGLDHLPLKTRFSLALRYGSTEQADQSRRALVTPSGG